MKQNANLCLCTIIIVVSIGLQHQFTRSDINKTSTTDAALTVIFIDSIITTRIDSLQSLILNSEDLDRLEAMKDTIDNE